MESDDGSSSAVKYQFNDFRDPQARKLLRKQVCYPMSIMPKHKILIQKIRKKRKPVHLKHRFKARKVLNYDHPMPLHSFSKITKTRSDTLLDQTSQRNPFEKREITPIQEEVFQFQKHSKRNGSFKAKAYQERVASLKVVVGRLREMCLAKPEVLQNNFPEETMKRFRKIQI